MVCTEWHEGDRFMWQTWSIWRIIVSGARSLMLPTNTVVTGGLSSFYTSQHTQCRRDYRDELWKQFWRCSRWQNLRMEVGLLFQVARAESTKESRWKSRMRAVQCISGTRAQWPQRLVLMQLTCEVSQCQLEVSVWCFFLRWWVQNIQLYTDQSSC